MATRAVIKIEGVDYASIYKHYDGYPEGMLPWLKDFNKANGNNSPDYKFAQLLRSSAFKGEEFNLDPSTSNGYGVIPFDADYGQEYEYVLCKNKSIEVYHRGRLEGIVFDELEELTKEMSKHIDAIRAKAEEKIKN